MKARTAIGLDIGTSAIRAAELSFGKTNVSLERFGQIAVPEGAVREGEIIDHDTVVAVLHDLWAATKFRSKKVVLGVANQRVLVRPFEMPYMTAQELRKALPFEAAEVLPMPVEQAVLDFHPLDVINRDGRQFIKGLLVAASKNTVMGHVNACHAAGLTPEMVDLTSFAALRAVMRSHNALVESEAVIDIGACVTNIVIHSAGVPKFVRILPMGGEDITEALGERLGLSRNDAEQMKVRMGLAPGAMMNPHAHKVIDEVATRFVDEVRGSLDYYLAANPGAVIDRFMVSGGGAMLRGLTDRLAQVTGIPCELSDPLATMDVGNTGLGEEQLAIVQSLAVVPVGLALGAV